RHIQDADVRALRQRVRTVLNLELGASAEILRLACRLHPFQATLVPERRQEITTEGGLALRPRDRKLADAIRRLAGAGIRVSLFIDPEPRTIERAAALGVAAIELHTGRYAHTWRRSDAALKPLGMSDFFALEAGEYLERLDALLQQSEAPGADEFVRLARALRGSALMANQQAIAKAAAGVESLARALREGRRPWDAQTKQLA